MGSINDMGVRNMECGFDGTPIKPGYNGCPNCGALRVKRPRQKSLMAFTAVLAVAMGQFFITQNGYVTIGMLPVALFLFWRFQEWVWER